MNNCLALRWWRPALAVAIRPWLWRAAARFIPDRPWLPSTWRKMGPYMRFRMETMYADPAAVPSAADTVSFLGWCRGMARVSHGKGP